MASVASDTIGGFNRFLEDQKKVPGTATFTLNQFDDQYDRIVDALDIQKAAPLTKGTFVPRGMTALLDAIGKSIQDTGERLEAIPEAERPAKVIMLIMTDGMENASREFTKAKINDLISHHRDVYKWEFVFLGANQDAIGTATSYGIRGASAMTYAPNDIGTTRAFASASANMTKYRTGLVPDSSFTAEDRRQQKDAGAENWRQQKSTEEKDKKI